MTISLQRRNQIEDDLMIDDSNPVVKALGVKRNGDFEHQAEPNFPVPTSARPPERMKTDIRDAMAAWRRKQQRFVRSSGTLDEAVRTKNGKFKLPGGQRIQTNHPETEFDRNVRARWRMLADEGLYEELDLANTWGKDALNQRRGIKNPATRAKALSMTVAELEAFDARVAELEADDGVWKKARDFYVGLQNSGIFDRDILTLHGLYLAKEQRVIGWDRIETQFGVSYRTILRRFKSGATLSEILRPVKCLEHEGKRYSAAQFARAFKVSKDRVRDGIQKGLSAEQILESRRSRGRPRRES